MPYFLDESKGWGTDAGALQAALDKARAEGTRPRALAVINPGNPTGQCMAESDVRAALSFCAREGLVAMADEVSFSPSQILLTVSYLFLSYLIKYIM